GQCIVIPDDENLTGGAALIDACMHLATGLDNSTKTWPDPQAIHRAANLVAWETIAAAKPRHVRRAE
ncbi:MAG: UDP-N-acetylglucosamine--N-acetylmuramyl-(pentapeptide) pyrophosphoryl-undecaprenol N-acetylglucosamine transferase, partial [Streptomycetaceae bacterium]|nr:UDP-N-acetylglucosamine--N-acetylmuramyl-(pentapeptide) pyrophosphoryl-undecaprenol N-acetylglucosamine transferase [Streptomycetaceae bacterium]